MSRGRPSVAAPAVAVALAAAAVYLGALGNGFAYDDVPLIPGDPRVRSLARIGEIFTTPYWPGAGTELGIYRPVTTLSFALDWAICGGSPLWFHLANLAWHVAASSLVFLLLLEFFPVVAATAGAVVFAVHPVHVEAVANVVGRGELLSAVFFLGACLLWVRRGDGSPTGRVVGTVCACFAVALFSKESAIMLPATLLLLDAAQGRIRRPHDGPREYARAHGPAFVALGIVAITFLSARAAVIGGHTLTLVHPAAEVAGGAWQRRLTALQAWPVYVRLLLFPRVLLADYGPRILMPATGWTAGALLGLTILAATAIGGGAALARGRARLALSAFWLPITILPVSNLILTIGVLVAERNLYLPSFALAAAVAVALAAARSARPPALSRLAWGGVGVAVVLLAARTVRRVPDWASTETVFQALLRDAPESYRGHWYLGRLERERGNRDVARARFDEALRLWPYRQALTFEAAALAVEDRRLDRAAEIAVEAARRWPGSVDAQRLLAAVSLDRGDTATARVAMRAGLGIEPEDPLLNAMSRTLFDSDAPH